MSYTMCYHLLFPLLTLIKHLSPYPYLTYCQECRPNRRKIKKQNFRMKETAAGILKKGGLGYLAC